MEGITNKEVSYNGENLTPAVVIDNDGWSTKQDELQILIFEGRRAHIPAPLSINTHANFKERNFSFITSKVTTQTPAFDWGLGCFGHANKIVETGKQELSEYHDLKTTAYNVFDGAQVWTDADWIHFQQQTKGENAKPAAAIDHEPLLEIRNSQEQFFSDLDKLEAARPEKVDHRKKQDGDDFPTRSTWQLKGFDSWIDEADFVEAMASAPSGTRYYNSRST
ncbi:hypothetical protein F4779DRAFT_603628 [Xylariaceae sp. FL0662B]|nr:hypothetical protein F4779DRAFT_603628 [Xylariaceae sp. FL0662B]